MSKVKWVSLGITILLLFALVGGVSLNIFPSVGSGGNLAVTSNIALAAQATEDIPTVTRYSGATTVIEQPWGYLYTLENGDIVEVGDSTTQDFKAHIKTIRWNGVADFSLWLEGGTFTPSLNGTTVSFDFNNDIHVQMYPVAPSERLPEGGIEYDITLNKKPAKPTVTLNADWSNITWTKILPLDEEYDQAACEEEWGVALAPFTITPTSITSDVSAEVLKTREEYKVNSYIGEATNSWHTSSGDLGGGVTYTNVSRSYLHLHRGQMTDALNDTAWVEDITLDEIAREFTFHLPKVWLRTATYPVSQVCGADPAYTEDWDSFGPGLTEGAWTEYDVSAHFAASVVGEIIITNDDAGKEYYGGVRNTSSSTDRRVLLHEAEGGGATSCRMFVQVDASQKIDYYTTEDTDIIFNVAGYWSNVAFTELYDIQVPDSVGSWVEETLLSSGAASRVCHILAENQYTDNSKTMGVRDTSSSLERKVLVHEPEGGGISAIDMMVKADANYKIDLYVSEGTSQQFRNVGYFGSEMDFVEDFQLLLCASNDAWVVEDLSLWLDEDGRVCDFLLLSDDTGSEQELGVRDGDDTTTSRYILEHEAEDDGGSTGELTGFGISAKSNASGEIKLYQGNAGNNEAHLMGYFKPAEVVDISNTPNTENLGVLSENSTYYAYGSAPSNPVVDAECTFTVTNNSGANVDITIEADNFTGGNGWGLISGTVGEDTVKMIAYYSGQNPASGVVVSNSAQAFISALADNTSKKWDFSLSTGTFTDGAVKTSVMTLAATLS